MSSDKATLTCTKRGVATHAYYDKELGWVGYVWKDGTISKKSNKTKKGAKGTNHKQPDS